jgi:hypothetical protein
MEDPVAQAANDLATCLAKQQHEAIRSVLDLFHGPGLWTMEQAREHLRVAYNPSDTTAVPRHRGFLFWDEILLAEIKTKTETVQTGLTCKMMTTTTVKPMFGQGAPWPKSEAP